MTPDDRKRHGFYFRKARSRRGEKVYEFVSFLLRYCSIMFVQASDVFQLFSKLLYGGYHAQRYTVTGRDSAVCNRCLAGMMTFSVTAVAQYNSRDWLRG